MFYTNDLCINLLSYKVSIYFNMFWLIMLNWIISHTNCWDIVMVHSDWKKHFWSQFFQKSLQPYTYRQWLIWSRMIKEQLFREFEIKDLRKLKYFLRMEKGKPQTGTIISQRKYILDLLQKTKMVGCKSYLISLEPEHKPKELWDKTTTYRLSYEKPVGKLIYLSHIRHDICYTVSFVSQLTHGFTNTHLRLLWEFLGI